MICGTALLITAASCMEYELVPQTAENSESGRIALSEVARILSCLPIGAGQLDEVHDAVDASMGNGYDEEYMMRDLFSSPGSGVGGNGGRGSSKAYDKPLRELFADYLATHESSRASGTDVQGFLDALEQSDIQIYWPYSEDWDGSSYPVITWDPGFGAESNYGYELKMEDGRLIVTDSVYVDENLAARRPVWVINRNDDSAFTPLDLYERPAARSKATNRRLYIKSFKMLRNYDSWFGGASEFRIQCGSVNGFKASTEADLNKYYPTVTDFTLVLRRKQVGLEVPLDAILMTDFTSSLEKLAFLVTEDDGGTRTSWKCSAVVKYNSRSYGFEMEIPYNEKDDIVWRGQLEAGFLREEDEVSARFGDVVITFALE